MTEEGFLPLIFCGVRAKGKWSQMTINTTDLFKVKMKYKVRNEFPVPCTAVGATGDQETEEADKEPGLWEHVPAPAICRVSLSKVVSRRQMERAGPNQCWGCYLPVITVC